jgi:hypothetical protein
MTTEDKIRECPFCRQNIVAGAKKCKHCLSAIEYANPDHGGQCPMCKEEIHPEATRCHHCKEWIGVTKEFLFGLPNSISSCCSGSKAQLAVEIAVAPGSNIQILRRQSGGGTTNVDCACVRDCRIVDGVKTCGPWTCTGPPGCLDLPEVIGY